MGELRETTDIHGWKEGEYAQYRSLLLLKFAEQNRARYEDWPIHCGDCSQLLGAKGDSYRCYHCEIEFCPACSMKHFGPRPIPKELLELRAQEAAARG